MTDSKPSSAFEAPPDPQRAVPLRALVHEIRNMAAPVANAAYLLQSLAASNPALGTMADMLARQNTALERLLTNVSEVTRLAEGEFVLSHAPVQSGEVIEQATRKIRALAASRGVTLEVAAAENLTLEADGPRLVHAVSCVLANAVEHAAGSGRVTVMSSSSGGSWRLRIANPGPALEPALAAVLFKWPGSAGAVRSPGRSALGLSLPLAAAILALHGGGIAVSRQGDETVFELSVPLLPATAQARGGNTRMEAAAPRASSGPQKVLVVDDSADVRLSVQEMAAALGADAAGAGGGEECLAWVKHDTPDLVLIDINMPGMNGFELARKLRPLLPKARLVLMSGVPLTPALMDSARASGFDYGFDKLNAPAELEKLLAG